jgi:hypothetical protein
LIARAFAFAVFSAALAACQPGNVPPTCLDYAETSYQGSYSIVAASGAMKNGLGAGADRLTVDDFDPFTSSSCPVDQSFLVHVGNACDLHARSTSVRYDTGRRASGAFLEANADIVSDADFACSVATTGGLVRLVVQSGTMTITPTAISLTFGGTTVSPTGVALEYSTFHMDGSLR